MAHPIHNIGPGVKRGADDGPCPIRQRQFIEEVLPAEVMEIVASHLQGEELKKLSKLSDKWNDVALRTKNVQELQKAKKELQVLANLGLSKQEKVLSVVDFYSLILSDIRRYLDSNKQDSTIELQQKLQALASEQLHKEFTELSYECYKEIFKGNWCLSCIEQKYLHKKIGFVAQALNHVISATLNPSFTRDVVLKEAAKHGYTEIVKNLMCSGHTATHNRILMVEIAARQGNLDLVKFLMTDQPALLRHLGLAFMLAQDNRHFDILDYMLESEVSEDTFSTGFCKAASQNNIEMMRFFLEKKQISSELRGLACVSAAIHGSLVSIKYLLDSGSISDEHKNWAISRAKENGHLDVAKYLEERVEISKK